MSLNQDPDRNRDAFITMCTVGACCMAVFALVVWALGDWRIGTLGADYVPMAPLTAWIFIALGAATLLPHGERSKAASRGLSLGMAICAGLVSVLILARSAFGFELGLEQWLAQTKATVGDTPVGRVSPLTALAFVSFALAFIFSTPPLSLNRQLRQASPALALVPLMISIAVLMSYAGGVVSLYSARLTPMALLTASAILLLSLALLAEIGPGTWLFSILPTTRQGSEQSGSLLYRRSAAALLLLVTGGIAIAGITYLRFQMNISRASAQKELSATADLKADQIARWYWERQTDARVVFNTPFVQSHLSRLLSGQADAADRAEVARWMDALRKLSPYRRVILYDAKGHPVIGAPANSKMEDISGYPDYRAALTARDVIISDLHRYPDGNPERKRQIHLTMWVPIRYGSGQALGFWILDIDPGNYLYPLIQKWPSPSPSAETLLIRREGNEVVYLNELRHRRNTALNLRFPLSGNRELPAAMAIAGKRGIVDGVDYRGIPVLAAILPVRGTPWFMVAKVDREEIYASLRERAELTGVIVLVLLILAVIGSGFIDRRRENQWLQQQLASERELQAYRSLLETVVHNLPTGAAIIRCDGLKVQLVNPAYQALLPGKEIAGKSIEEVWPELKARFSDLCRVVLETGEAYRAVDEMLAIRRSPSGPLEEAYFTWSIFRVLLPDDQSWGILHTVWETTERKKAEESLREANERLEESSHELSQVNEEMAAANEELHVSNDELHREITYRKQAEQEITRARADAERHAAELGSFISSIADGVLLFSAEGEITYVNDACLRMFGAHPGESFTERFAQFERFDESGNPTAPERFPTRQGLQGKTVRDVYERMVGPGGEEIVVSVSASPVFGPRGAIIGATAVFRDVRERVEFEKQREEVYRREHHIADVLQQALIPPQTDYMIPCCRIAVRYQPALKEAEVGGDFYDVFQLDETRYAILIGDVAGKGLAAAIRVAAARYAIRSYAFIDRRPGRVLTLANAALCKDDVQTGGMLTAFFGIIDVAANTITYASGGHEPPVIRDTLGIIHELEATGIPLGISEDAQYTEGSHILRAGYEVVMMTDGITEARAPGTVLFGKKGVEAYLATNGRGDPDEIASGLLEAAVAHAGGKLQDDAAVLALVVLAG